MWSPWINILAVLELCLQAVALEQRADSLVLQVHLGHKAFVSARDGTFGM